MGIGADMIFMVKTNTRLLCKETIENITKAWTGGSYLVLRSKPMVPGGRPSISIGCKYNTRKVIPFFTEDTGITKACIPYLSK